MAMEQKTNRRQEQRMPLADLDLKVRRAGLSHSFNTFQHCRSIDLSHNGIAFANKTLGLNVPEKVDFILTLYGHEVKGHAVTCNKRETSKGTLYGLMFLSITPEISYVFSEEKLTTQALENLAKNQAEALVLSLLEHKEKQEKLLLSKQQQLFDACRCYLIRLGEMGVRMPSKQSDKALPPGQAVRVFRDHNHKLLLSWYNRETATSNQLSVVFDLEVMRSTYVVNDEYHCSNVTEVLDILGQHLKQHLRFI